VLQSVSIKLRKLGGAEVWNAVKAACKTEDCLVLKYTRFAGKWIA
jgi:hypothetical protein